MHPYFGSLSATTFGWLLAAMLAGGFIVWSTYREGLGARQIAVLLLGCTAALLVGAKILYLIEVVPQLDAFVLLSQQVRLPGGMLVVLLVSPWFPRRSGASTWHSADTIAAALGLLILGTRIGCFLQGCCYGRPSSHAWALPFPRGSEVHTWQTQKGMIASAAPYSLPVEPLQLYFAFTGALLFLTLTEYLPRKRYEGEIALLFAVAYFWSTWLLEGLRAQLHPVTEQFSLLVAVAATAVVVYVEARRRLAISSVGGSRA